MSNRMSDTRKQPKTPKPNIDPVGYSTKEIRNFKLSDESIKYLAELINIVNYVLRDL